MVEQPPRWISTGFHHHEPREKPPSRQLNQRMSDLHYTCVCSKRTGSLNIQPYIVSRWSFRLLLKLRKIPAFQTVRCQTLSYWQSLCSTHGKRFIFIMLLYTSYTLLTKFAIDYLWLLNAWYPAYCCPILARGPRSASAEKQQLTLGGCLTKALSCYVSD